MKHYRHPSFWVPPREKEMSDDSESSPLWEAYRATTYRCIPDDDPSWSARIGTPAPVAGPLAYITADNPSSQRLSKDENRRRHQALAGELAADDRPHWPGQSIADDGQWPVERGFWVGELTADEARRIGMRYGQNAVVFIDPDAAVHLIDCRP